MDYLIVEHNISPVYDENSKILILGSFPSVKSRETEFFYGHPRNRFWNVITNMFGENIPVSIEEKKNMLLKHNIAVWDVIKSCEIIGSSDSSIRNIVVNDITSIIAASQIKYIYTNGRKADDLYSKYLEDDLGIKAVCLPSTSPANATWSNDRLLQEWKGKIVPNL